MFPLASRRVIAMAASFVSAVACAEQPPPPSVATTPSPAPTPTPSNAPTTSAPPPMPSMIASCEPADENGIGAWTPTVDDLVAAVRVLPAYCVPVAAREDAVRACAAKLHNTRIKLAVGDEAAMKMCWEEPLGVEANGRRWIADHYFFQYGSQFSGSGAAAEMTNGRASLYLENSGLIAACDSKATAPKDARADFASLPVDVAKVLCGWKL